MMTVGRIDERNFWEQLSSSIKDLTVSKRNEAISVFKLSSAHGSQHGSTIAFLSSYSSSLYLSLSLILSVSPCILLSVMSAA